MIFLSQVKFSPIFPGRFKTGRTSFAIVEKKYVDILPSVNDKILVTPYARRDFSGTRIDTPRQEGSFSVRRLGGWNVHLPTEKPQCPELADLIQQLEVLPAPDSLRTIVHMLVDAKATHFETVDPSPTHIVDTPPTIRFSVSTEKMNGTVSIIYIRGNDSYSIEFKTENSGSERIEYVLFDELGEVLFNRIDDGKWKTIHIDVLSKAKTKKTAAKFAA